MSKTRTKRKGSPNDLTPERTITTSSSLTDASSWIAVRALKIR